MGVVFLTSLHDESINTAANQKDRFSKNIKMKPKESPLCAIRKIDFPIDRRTALKIALEDAETSHFILKYFSRPEQKPHILSRKRIIQYERRFIWLIELIEKVAFCTNGKKEMLNIARIEIDPFCGKIVGRQYFQNLFEDEYRKIVSQRERFKRIHR